MKLLPLSLAVAVLALAACNKPADSISPPAASTGAPAVTVAPAAAATVSQAPADAGSIDTFDLTMDNVDRMLRAQVALGAATKADPSLDPALAGGVILTTVTDVMGFLAFLGLATLILLR